MIGISDYAHLPKLINPTVDVSLVAAKLHDAGYQVTVVAPSKTTRSDLLKQFDQFLNNINENDTVLIYYSGHGVDIKGDNELVPADAPAPGAVSSDAVLRSNLISFHDIMQDIQDRDPAVQVWVIDACRNNPYATGTRGGGPQGLVPSPPAQGRYVLYSADYNQSAIDHLPNENPTARIGSPFSRTFVSLFDEGRSKDIDLFRRDISNKLKLLVAPQAQFPTAENGMSAEWCLDSCGSGVTAIAVNAKAKTLKSNTAAVLAIKNSLGAVTVLFSKAAPLVSARSSGAATSAVAAPILSAVSEKRGVVFLGKRSAGRCHVGNVSDLYPFGCKVLQDIVKHFDSNSSDPKGGYVGQTIKALTPVNVRRGLPIPAAGGTTYGCRVRLMKTGEGAKLASTAALTYAGDVFYWGVIDGPEAVCLPPAVKPPPAAL